MTPARTTAIKNISHVPKVAIAFNTITAKPAAGPLTPKFDPLMAPTTIPPTIPAIIPENKGAPEAKAMPKHNGVATRKTTTLAGKSLFRLAKILELDFIICNFD